MLGEKLLIKMWETLTEKGIGSLLEPWHKSRISKAELEAKRNEIIILADAERKAEDIKKGLIKLNNPDKLTLSNVDKFHTYIESSKKIENIKKEINVSKAILYAEEELKNDTQEAPKEDINEDWLYKWKNNASETSTEELQQIWGRLLAGELKSPGKYSLRTMEFLKNISQKEAILIEKVAQFNIDGWIFKNEEAILEKNNISFSNLIFLEELGILNSVAAVGLGVEYKSDIKDSFQKALFSNDKALLLTHQDSTKIVTLNVYALSKLGIEVLSLGHFNHNEEYLISVAKQFISQGFEVELADWKRINDTQMTLSNRIQVKADSYKSNKTE